MNSPRRPGWAALVQNGRAWAMLTAASAALCIAADSGWLPGWLRFVAKPLTTAMIIAFAWPRGESAPRQRLAIRIGLLFSLAGDVFLLWPVQGFLPGLVSFLLAHLAYIAAFCAPVRLMVRRVPFVAYALLAGVVLSQLWPGIPAPLRAPVIAYVICLAAMAAQAAAWWRASIGGADESLARHAALGGLLFMLSDSLLAINKFATPLPLASLWILASYWLAQWCIAASLEARRPAR